MSRFPSARPFGKPRTEQRRSRKARPNRRLLLEALEDRVLPSTVTWVASGGGDWGTAANWSPGLPGPADDVVIPALSGATITHSTGTDTVHSITSGSTIALTGGTLTVNGNLQVSSPAVVELIGAAARLDNATLTSGSKLVLPGNG